jgi:hypothetical protein
MKTELYGNRWDENEPALALEERFNRASPSKQIEALESILNDTHNRFGNEVARAAGVIILNKLRNPSKELLELAIKNHRYIAQDHDWMSNFPDHLEAMTQIHRELDGLSRKLASCSSLSYASALELVAARVPRKNIVSASSYIVRTEDSQDSDAITSVFSSFVSNAVIDLIESDDSIRPSAEAVEEAISDSDRKHRLPVSRIKSIYLPLVQTAVEKLYSISGSGQRKASDLFTATICDEIAHVLASEWRRNH